MNQSTALAPQERRSILYSMATRYNMDPTRFAQTLRATVVPSKCTDEEFAAFLVVAYEYQLNPLTKEIYAFPGRNGGIQPIVSIDGWVHLINSHPAMDGLAFDDHETPDGRLTAITAVISRKDREKPISVTEYMAECYRKTEPWDKYPRRMLRHKALIQCARYAFGFSGIIDQDEHERMVPIQQAPPEPEPAKPRFDRITSGPIPPLPENEPPPRRRGPGRPRKQAAPVEAHDEVHDPVTGEIGLGAGWPEPEGPPPDEPEAPDLNDPDVAAGFNDAQAGRKTCLDPAIRRTEARFAKWRAGYYHASGEDVTS